MSVGGGPTSRASRLATGAPGPPGGAIGVSGTTKTTETPNRGLPFTAGTVVDWYSRAASVPVALLAICLLGLTLIQLRWGLAFLRWPLEVLYGEALIQDHAARLLRGEALYQPLGEPAYSLAAYTPFFYVLMALGQFVGGPNLIFGRVVSVLAMLATALLVGKISSTQGRGLAAGALGALLFVALGFPTPIPWFALAKEDSLGVAFGVASVVLLAGGQSRHYVLGAGLLAALAILTKQTFIAAGLAGTIALLLRDRREVPWFVAASLGPVAIVCAFFEFTTHAFLTNTVFANAQPFRADILLTNLATLKAYQAGPLAVAGLAVVRRLLIRKSFEDVLLPVYGLATVLPLVGLASVGSAQNYWIELAAAASLLAAAEIFWWLRAADLRWQLVGAALALVPFVNVIVAGRLALIWLPGLEPDSQQEQVGRDFAGVLQAVKATDGPVIAEPLDSVVLAGKAVLVEPWAADALYRSGTWDIQPLVSQICRGDIQLAVLAHSLDQDVLAYNDFGIWPTPMLDAMRNRMTLRETRAGRYLYVPRQDGGC